MTSKYNLTFVKSLDETLITQWKDLWKHAENASVFNSYEWLVTCQDAGEVQAFELLVCHKGDTLVAILPLQPYKRYGIPVAGSICTKYAVDTAFLALNYDKELLQVFFEYLTKKRNIFLQKTDKEASEKIHKLFPNIMCSLMSVNPMIPLEGELFASVSPSTISQIKKVLRKNPDQITFKLFKGNEITKKHLQQMFDLDQNSSKKLQSMDLFSKQAIKDFFFALCKHMPEFARMGFLYLDGRPICYQFGFLYNDYFVAYQTAYLYEFSKLRPGKTMIYHLMQTLKDEKAKVIDLGGGISMYKQEFTPDYRILYDLYYSKNSLYMMWWKFVNHARRLNQTYRPIKNTRDHEFLFKTL